MAEFANMSEILNRLSGGNSGNPETLFFNKELAFRSGGTALTTLAGKTYSWWLVDGGFPGFGAVPSTAAVPTSATAGAIPFTNASGGREKRIVCATVCAAYTDLVREVFLYDRLLHVGGLSGTSASAQNVQSGSGVSLTRHTGGAGNEIWIEIYTAIGSTTGRTVTASYTNQAGTASRTTIALPIGGASAGGVREVAEVVRLPLQAGDTGVQSVETITLSGTTGTAGSIGVTIANRIASIPLGDIGIGIADFAYGDSGTVVLEDGACIAAMYRANFATLGWLTGVITTAER